VKKLALLQLSAPAHASHDDAQALPNRLRAVTHAVATSPLDGHVAEWLRNGLQNRVPRFNSGRGLQHLANAISLRVNIKSTNSRPARGTAMWRVSRQPRQNRKTRDEKFVPGATLRCYRAGKMAKLSAHGNWDLPALIGAEKELVSLPAWILRGADTLDLTAPLEIGGVAVEGLTLRGRARKPLADREVIFQLECHTPEGGGPVCRIEWRPLNRHNNKGLGPKQLRNIIQDGSHHHRFDLNWARSQAAVLRGELPIAVPLEADPTSFRALLAVVGKEFRIKRIQSVPEPPWEPAML
jgi:hypothetical protein